MKRMKINIKLMINILIFFLKFNLFLQNSRYGFDSVNILLKKIISKLIVYLMKK
jgi:hypothetical protein